MKSRLALTLVLVAGFMLSTTGATLAVSGSSGSGSASVIQYGDQGGNSPAGTKGDKGDKADHQVKGADSEGGNQPNQAAGKPDVEVAPATVEQQAVVSSGSSLPFTGFVAIPLLVIGLGLIVVGAVIRLKSRNDQIAGS